ncbi:MAG TPA: hypothetical protein VIO39_01965 [Methylotenera sp.]
MSGFNFRFRFNLPNGFRIDSDDEKIELIRLNSEIKLTLASGQTGVSIKECPRAVVTGNGFSTFEEAQVIAEKVKQILLVWSVKYRHGIDLGDGRQRNSFTKAGLAFLEMEHGCPIKNDIHGIDVFEHVENLKFIHVDMQAAMQKHPESLVKIFHDEINVERSITPKQELACELYASSWFDVSYRSRFITLVTAIEALIEQHEHTSEVTEWVRSAKNSLTLLSLPDEVTASVRGSLERLRYQSISLAGRELVKCLLPSTQFQGMDAEKFFKKCYTLRSEILHNGAPPQDIDMLQAANEAEEFVAKLLLSSLGITPAC